MLQTDAVIFSELQKSKSEEWHKIRDTDIALSASKTTVFRALP